MEEGIPALNLEEQVGIPMGKTGWIRVGRRHGGGVKAMGVRA